MESRLTPYHLRCEYLENPLGLTVRTPHLSWQVKSDRRNQRQGVYYILVARTPEELAEERGTLWDSGGIASDRTTHIPYNGVPLQSNQRCYWQVRVWDPDDPGEGEVSEVGFWQMGLLDPDDWQAEWIGLEVEPYTPAESPHLQMNPATYLRHTFALDKPVAHATLYATAMGVYLPYLNGERVGDTELPPGWTDYHQRVQVQAYDVTANVQRGENAIGAILGDGWYSGYLGFGRRRAHYGEQPRLLMQLHIAHPDGSTTIVTTGKDWQATTGPILYSDIQMGEHYDARREMAGWSEADFDATEWQAARSEARDPAVALDGQPNQPLRVTREVQPVSVTEFAPGVFIFDLGQNMVGRVRLMVRDRNAAGDKEGDVIRLRYAEILEPDGSLHTANLRSARATDFYTLKGSGESVYEPHFTYHGFRYVEVTGYPGEPTVDDLVGRVIHNDMPETGTFTCSNELVNQLWRNILWGQRGNFVSVPTDCPQRDERLGWTGDAQIFCRTASFNMDVSAFFTKWLVDLEDAQTPAGAFPDVAPQIAGMNVGVPAWGDAGVIIPWTIYRVYGDRRIIDRHYEAMQEWMRYIAEANPYYLRTKRLNNNYSDWVALERGSSAEQIATVYWARIARMMAEMAEAIGRDYDADYYAELYEKIRQAYLTAYVHADGYIEGNTQTAYALALDEELVPDALRPAVAARLVQAIERSDGHLATGFLGTPALCFALAETGHLDVAYHLLTNETYPSWLYMVKNGATTMWERWNAFTIEGGIHDPGMNSFNHYAYGAIGEWLYRVVAGIEAAIPGYRHVQLRPRPLVPAEGEAEDFTHAHATYHSIHGPITSGWRREEDGTHYEISLPANTTAVLELPTTQPYEVRESGNLIADAEGVAFVSYENGLAIFIMGSGDYHFVTE